MQLDTLLQAAEADKKVLEGRRAELVEEIEKYRAERLQEIGEVEGQIKRIDKVLRAAGANVNGSKPKAKEPKGAGKLNIGLPLLERACAWAAEQTEQFRQTELRDGTGITNGQDTYAVRCLTALGWLKRYPDATNKNRWWFEWDGPKADKAVAELRKQIEVRETPGGGWRFNDDNVQRAAVAGK